MSNSEEKKAANRKYIKDHPERARAANKKWYYAHPERAKEIYKRSDLKRRFGMTPEDLARMETEQGGRCAICRTDRPGGRWNKLHIDHDHKTGKVRGLLCHACNTAVGLLNEDLRVIASLVEYLKTRR